METNFQEHVNEWLEMTRKGRFAEARQYYFDELFEEVVKNFENKISYCWPLELVLNDSVIANSDNKRIDVLFSILGCTPEPIILAARALHPKKHIIFHDKGVTNHEDNLRFLPKFLPEGFEKVELPDESFRTIYTALKQQMALNAGRNYTVNVTGGKKSMVAAASIFARDFNSSIIYVDYEKYDSNIRRPLPGYEFLNVVYSPICDLPEMLPFLPITKKVNNDIYTSESTTVNDVENSEETQEIELIKDSPIDNELVASSASTAKISNIVDTSNSAADYSLKTLITKKDWMKVSSYFDKNLYGGNIPQIRREITDILLQCDSVNEKLEIADFLLGYNTSIFLATVSNEKLYTSKVDLNLNLLDSIIKRAFSCEDKLKYAIGILRAFERYLSLKEYDYIKEKCRNLNSYSEFNEFLTIVFESDEAKIDYLSDSVGNPVTAFALYQTYLNLENANLVKENSPAAEFRPSHIRSLCAKYSMVNSYLGNALVSLIKNNVLHEDICTPELKREVEENGFAGFQSYLQKKEHLEKSKAAMESLTIGAQINGLRYIKTIGDYYLFTENKTSSYALMDKTLCVEIPSKDIPIHATIVKILQHKGKTVFVVTQKTMSTEYKMPDLIKVGDLIEVGFMQNQNGDWYPTSNNYWKILTLRFKNRPADIDYRKKQTVKVIKPFNFFTYLVEICR